MPRYFVSKEEINLPNITFTGENAHHLLTVLRAKEGERVEVCDGCGTDYLCRVEQAGCTLAILKAKSPSSGVGQVYDGSFTGTLKQGDGVFAANLRRAGVKLLTEKDLSKQE